MKTRSKVWLLLSSLLIISMLAACATPTPQVIEKEKIVTQEVEKIVTQEVEKIVTQEVEKIVEVTPEPVARTGGWLDRIVMVEEESQEAAVTRLAAGEIDVYAFTADDANVFETVKANADLEYAQSFGSYNEITFNTAEFTDGRLNPFSNPKLREAVNYLVDRNYIVQEILSGLGFPKFFSITAAFPDYARYIDTVRELEAKYAYNLDAGKAIVETEMAAMGAELVDGKWAVNGEPINLIFLIRVEDERQNIGDYVAGQLEQVGFQVDRQFKTRSEASPLWVQSDPAEGLWNLYTGGWITTAIARDQGSNFAFFYTPLDYPIPLHQAYLNSDAFMEVALKLRNNDFTTMEERADLFKTALELSMQESQRVWCSDQVSFSPFRKDVAVTYDLAGSISGAQLWPKTIKWESQEGGSMKIAQPGLLIDPWNPVAGSNWIYDSMPIRATNDYGLVSDPYTGLQWPNRIEKADVVVKEGLPVAKTLDWVNLEFAPEIEVPADAWYDWDPIAQKFITIGEAFTETQTAMTKATVYYPAGFDGMTWHDGSPVTVADFIMNMITTWDYGKEGSKNYDPALAETLGAFMAHFKGVKIVSTDPLVIETYDDLYQLDAELIPTSWWPAYTYGPGAWHTVALGAKADADNAAAFSADKAADAEIEWQSWVSGPSLEILAGYLDTEVMTPTIPFTPTMNAYVTAEEAATRWENLDSFYSEQGHFWVGCGPYYLDKVFPVEGTLTLLRYEAYPDAASKWDRFSEPKIATVEVDGPGNVTIGTEATFDVFVNFKEEAYPQNEIAGVKWLLFDATGALVATGEATPAADGQYQIALTTDQTNALAAGSNKLEVAVSPIVVSIPSLASFEFITTAP